MSGPNHCSRLALALLLAMPVAAAALASAREQITDEQTIEWSADGDSSMSTVDGARNLRMTRNVVITQGSLEIRGDEALLAYGVMSNELDRVTVQGAPARYRQELDNGETVTGSGSTIVFRTDEDGNAVIEIIGSAEITSLDMNARCESIVYVAETGLIRASGNCAGAFTPGND